MESTGKMKKTNQFVDKKIIRQVVGLMAVAVLIIAVNGYLNFTVRNSLPMGYMCIFTSTGISVLIAYLIIVRNHQRTYLIGLILVTIHLLSYQIIGADREIALAWILVLPLVSFYTQGLRRGSIYTGILFLLLAVIYRTNHLRNVFPAVSSDAYMEGAAVFIVMSILTFIYERSSQTKEETIYSQHYFDGLTSLPNRNRLMKDIDRYRENTLILVNIDNFKEINNFIGIMGGDIVLREIAYRYQNNLVTSGFTLYKLHADEFALLLPGKKEIASAVELAREIQSIMDTDIEIGHTDLIVSVSIGISDDMDLLTTADTALKSSKLQKVPYVIYSSDMAITKKYEENIYQLYRIQKGIENNAFVPHFQPIFDLNTNEIRKYECLIRLCDESEIIPPSQFIEISKRSKKYHHLTRIMVTKSFEYFQNHDYDFSINLCLEDLENQDTTTHIYAELEKFEIGHRVIFEFLESERIENNPEVINFIKRIRSFNCRTAIDDFGSGYSNFDFILRMKFDFLKIDATLVREVNNDINAQILISTIVNFSRDMGIQTIAEYVCEEEIFNKVKELGVDFAQGYYIGLPDDKIQKEALFAI